MRTDLFDYRLPEELIAQRPSQRRGASRLLVVNCETGEISHGRFSDLPGYLREGDCAVFNRTRVRKARLRGRKAESGGAVEMLLLSRRESGEWEALAKPARRLRPGTRVGFGQGELEAEVLEVGEGGRILVRLSPGDAELQEELVERLGEVPLPPYIRERLEDPERYQTVYARETGSAAAPTAGLHFEPGTMEELRRMGVTLAFLRLDVGLDTFRPISEAELEGHRMHSEEVHVDDAACAAVNAARKRGGRVLAVGTTVVRALESAAGEGGLEPLHGHTDLYITPGHRFRAVDFLLTNFHMPRSSLLVLVSAFAGRELVLEAYRKAVEARYRFLSFGDACLFFYPNGWKRPSGPADRP
ncbi:MAG: tRNA preQ1(34) S-adenosylmethionine ribosyltransferase-isomerase QueA [Actinobacteria bacterium]|nr:tRNA preQ1(34) S-adenosylmethionine ribosyltransferase-isomerase QueA [Actinomycetota bacterium]